MIKNYLKTAFRSLLKNKGFTAINVLGLTLGIATCLLIVFYVLDELSYDKYNLKADRIFRVNNDVKFAGMEKIFATAPEPTAAALKADFPEIEQVTRFRYTGGNRVKKGLLNIQEDRTICADSTVFSVFTWPMIEGNPEEALKAPNSVVITERMARKYFNRTDVVGQTLTFDDTSLYKVTGVIKDIPAQSHINFDFFISMANLGTNEEGAWLTNNFATYVVLKPGADYKNLQAKMPVFLRKHVSDQLQGLLHLTVDAFEQSGSYYRFTFFPITKIHLESNALAEFGPNGSITYVYIFSAIAVFILLIACINFMNLSTARSSNRAREVGVRKVLGSPRKYLIAQFLTESVMLTLAGAILAMILAWALLPVFNDISGKQLIVSARLVRWLIPILSVFVLVIGCLAGFYPAFFLSAFQPIDVLKGKLARGFKGGGLRSFLVVFQFAISIFLITGTLVVYNQLNYIQSRDIGFDRDHMLVVQNVYGLGNQARTFKEEVKKISGADNATMTSSLPTNDYGNSTSLFRDRGLDAKGALHSQQWTVDEDYLTTLGIKLVAGRNFSRQMLTDSTAILINEAAANQLAFADPLNQTLYAPANAMLTKLNAFHIIGVV
jgi:putative ABC transport system permease protein